MTRTALKRWAKHQIQWRYDQWKYKSQYQLVSENKSAIFCLHGFNKVFWGVNYGQSSKDMLRGCLRTLSHHYRFVSLSTLMRQNEKNRSVEQVKPAAAFTIDDGFQSILSVLDVFKKFQVVPTIFICPGLIDEETLPFPEIVRLAFLLTDAEAAPLPTSLQTIKLKSLDDRIRITTAYIEHLKRIQPQNLHEAISSLLKNLNLNMADIERSKYYDPLLRWDQIKKIFPSVEIGSHTCRHLHLSTLSVEESHYEISASKTMIEKKLSCECDHIAYPFGDRKCFIPREEQYVQESGYRNAYILEPSYFTNHDSPFRVPRFNIGNGLGMLNAYRQVSSDS